MLPNLPDHPDIAMALEAGYPEPVQWPVCPVCGADAETFFKDERRDIVGCNHCIIECDAWEEMENERFN